MMSSTTAMFVSAAAIMAMIALLILDVRNGNLNIKSRTVGDGQYGTARWATKREIDRTYSVIPFEPDKWRQGKRLPSNLPGSTVLGYIGRPGHIQARIDTSESHTMLLSTTGGGKTTFFLYPNLEMACACGYSFLVTDTKGDNFRDFAGIAQKYYGYTPYVIDLRNPTRSHGFNILHLVNKYMDLFKSTGDISAKAHAERYAKITAKTIVHMDGFTDGGQNQFFYEAAEGLIAATILLVSEFCVDGERHIVSVFKLLKELLKSPAPIGKEKPKTDYQRLIEMLPPEHKASWLSGAALNAPGQTISSVISTAMGRLLSFIDSELEQILCFDSSVDAEQFCKGRTAVFIVFPEEDSTKHFLVSLFITQLYNEAITIANQKGTNKLDQRVLFFIDEFGTIPKLPGVEQMFSAGRSRNVFLVPILQSMAQLDKNYGKDGAQIILDNCQNVVFGGLAPLSQSADFLSRALGTQTVQSGSVSHSSDGFDRNNSSHNLQMIQKPLMTAEQLRSLPQDKWVLMKTRCHPTITTIRRYNQWGIKLDSPYTMPTNETREVHYANAQELMFAVHRTYTAFTPREPQESRQHISSDLLN